MTQAELIETARSHLKSGGLDREAFEALTKTRFREAAVIYFGADNRNDYFEVVVDRDTGEMISATYFPKN